MLSQTPGMRTRGEVWEKAAKSLGSSVNAEHPLQGGQGRQERDVCGQCRPCLVDLGLSPHLTALMAGEQPWGTAAALGTLASAASGLR